MVTFDTSGRSSGRDRGFLSGTYAECTRRVIMFDALNYAVTSSLDGQ